MHARGACIGVPGPQDPHNHAQWPASKLKVQVLDDSDCTHTRNLVDARVQEWRTRGADVDLIRRTHRQGYKAGALQEGGELVRDMGYQYVAIFDADFRPYPDFLMKTVGYLEANDDVALVQVCEDDYVDTALWLLPPWICLFKQ